MSFLKPIVQQPKPIADYLKTDFEVLVKDIHPIDQIELHKQIWEIVYSKLKSKAMMEHRLENSLNNTTAQLQLQRASSQAKENIIKYLEDLIVGLGHNPMDIKAAEGLINKKNEDVVALRKKLKLPLLMHPQIAEIIEKRNEEDLLDLVLKLNEQLKETEQELEKSLQSRQSESTSQLQNVVPVVSTAVPSILATALAPNVPLAITEIIEVIGIGIGTSQVGT